MDKQMPSEHFKEAIEELIQEHSIENPEISVSKGSETGDNYLGEIFRVVIEGTKDGKRELLKLIVKSAPSAYEELRDHMKINKIYERECFVYSKLHPALEELQNEHLNEQEKYHYAKLHKCSSEEFKELLIFEDLAARNFSMYDRHLPFDRDHLYMCVENLAKFHAATMVMKDQRPELYEETLKMSCDMEVYRDLFKCFVEKSKNAVVEVCKDEPYEERLMSFYENMNDKLYECLNPDATAPYNTICHGDCWSNNILFQYENSKPIQMIMVDYQILREATPVTDIAYMLYLGMDKEMRKKHYKEVLKLYYTTLSKNVTKMGTDINKVYPENVYWDHIDKYMKVGLIFAIIVLPFTQGEKGEAIDINDVVNKVEDGGIEAVPTSDRAKKRLKDLVEDCLVYGIL